MTDATPTSETRQRSRRSSAVIAALLAAAALALWAASRMTWVRVFSVDGLGEERTSVLVGGTWAAATTPLALVLVAAVAATFAVRGWSTLVVAAVVALVAIVAAVPAATLVFSGASADTASALAELPDRAEVSRVEVSTAPALLVLVASVLAVLASIMIVRSSAARGGLSSRYDAPAVRRERAELGDPTGDGDVDPSQREIWDALDAGLDPTGDMRADPAGDMRADPAGDMRADPAGDMRADPTGEEPRAR